MLNRTMKAFTLLELIVVLLVLGILAAIAVPTFNTVKKNSAEKTFQASAEAIARNATAIAVSAGYPSVHTEDLSLATEEAGINGYNGAIWGYVGSYMCGATLVVDGLDVDVTDVDCGLEVPPATPPSDPFRG